MNDTTEKIATYIQSISDVDSPDALNNDTKIMSLGYVDSFNVLGILTYIEEEFDISIDLELITLDNFDSINSIAHLVQQVQSGGAPNG